MQTNGVKQSIERVRIEDSMRVSSEEIKQNYTQITGREALERLLAGETIYFSSGTTWKIEGFELRGTHIDGRTFTVTDDLSNFLDPTDTNWYVAPPFDARKEMLARPGEWVAKYFGEDGSWHYVGFDRNEMVALVSEDIRDAVDLDVINDVPRADLIDAAIPLDMQDVGKIAWGEAKEGVNANG